MRLDDPRLAAEITSLVDRRVDAALSTLSDVRYGTVASISGGKVAVYLGGSSTPSPGFVYPPGAPPLVGDRVRVRIAGADRYVEANLSRAAGDAVSPVGLLYGWTWYKSTASIACGADVETAVDVAFRVTYPGNPARAGQYVAIRASADVSMTYTVANVEGGIALYSDVSPEDSSGTRLRWARNRAPALATAMFHTHTEATRRWLAETPVEFRIVVRFSSAGSALIYGNATAAYVSRIGYEVVGYTTGAASREEDSNDLR